MILTLILSSKLLISKMSLFEKFNKKGNRKSV